MLAESSRAWRLGKMGFGNVSLTLSQYGLPSSLEELRRYVNGG